MLRALLVALCAALALAGCGGDDESAEDVLAETATKLGEIRSGTLDFGLLVTPRRGNEFGFELRGPFSFGKGGSLPVMEVEYAQIANGRRGEVTLISTGETAYARVGDDVTKLTEEQTAELRAAVAELEQDGGLAQLPVDRWIRDAELSGDGETERVEGELDIVETVNGLLDLARGFGRDMPRIEGGAADQLRSSTRSTAFELETGKDDRLLRLLRMEADFGVAVPEELRAALGELVGAGVSFHLGIRNPNEPVTVQDPTR